MVKKAISGAQNKRRISLITVCAVLMVTLGASVALGYATTNYGYFDSNCCMNTDDVSSSYTSSLSAARDAWNNTGVVPYVVLAVVALNKAYTKNLSSTEYGYYSSITRDPEKYPKRQTTSFSITLNTRQCDSLSENQKRGVWCHEIGHAFGLNDYYSSSPAAVMNNGCMATSPTKDDINGVKVVWW